MKKNEETMDLNSPTPDKEKNNEINSIIPENSENENKKNKGGFDFVPDDDEKREDIEIIEKKKHKVELHQDVDEVFEKTEKELTKEELTYVTNLLNLYNEIKRAPTIAKKGQPVSKKEKVGIFIILTGWLKEQMKNAFSHLLKSLGACLVSIVLLIFIWSSLKYWTSSFNEELTFIAGEKIHIKVNPNSTLLFEPKKGWTVKWNMEFEECTSLATEKISVNCLISLSFQLNEDVEKSFDVGDRIQIFEENNFWKVKEISITKEDIFQEKGKGLIVKKKFKIFSNIHSLEDFSRFRKARFLNFIDILPPASFGDTAVKIFRMEKILDFNYFYIDEKIFSSVILQNYNRKFILKNFRFNSVKIKNGGPRGFGKSLVFYYICKLFRGVFSSCNFDGGAGENDNTQFITSIINENSVRFDDFPGDSRMNNETKEEYGSFFSELVQTLFISGCGDQVTLDEIKTDRIQQWHAIECNYPITKIQKKKINDVKLWSSTLSQQYLGQIVVLSLPFVKRELDSLQTEAAKRTIDMYDRMYNQIFEKIFGVKSKYLIVHDRKKELDMNKILQSYIGRNLFKTNENVFEFSFCLPEKELDCGIFNSLDEEDSKKYLECLRCMSKNNLELSDLYLSVIKSAVETINHFKPKWSSGILGSTKNAIELMLKYILGDLYFPN